MKLCPWCVMDVTGARDVVRPEQTDKDREILAKSGIVPQVKIVGGKWVKEPKRHSGYPKTTCEAEPTTVLGNFFASGVATSLCNAAQGHKK